MGYEANEKGIDFETLKETAENITGEQAWALCSKNSLPTPTDTQSKEETWNTPSKTG